VRKIDVQPDADWFKLSTDRKTAFFARPKGDVVTNGSPDPNTFGLPIGRAWSCKDATDWCEDVCYADSPWPTVKALLHHNWDMYQRNKHSVHGLVGMLRPLIEESRRWARKREEAHVFRWFWAGDIPGQNFATAMRVIAGLYPDSTFWVYTRNYDVVPILEPTRWPAVDNLAVYLSVDRDNVNAALVAKSRNPWVRLAFCGDTWEETEDLAALFEGERKGPRCPELTGKIPLLVWGAEGTGRGACVECGMCLTGINNVRFAANG